MTKFHCRPQPTEGMMIKALGSRALTHVDLTLATKCHHATIANLMKKLYEEGKVRRSRGENRAYIYWVKT